MTKVKKFNNFKLTIKVITPVHIGSGDYANIMNSFEYKNNIYGFNFLTLIDTLNPKEIQDLVKHYKRLTDTTNQDNKRQTRQPNECDSTCEKCNDFSGSCYRDNDMTCQSTDKCEYQERCVNPEIFPHCKDYKPANEESFITKIKQISTYTIRNPKTIDDKKREFIMRGANGFPYIPGSSLNGAIVSAFFTQSQIGLDKDNFSLKNDNYLAVGDAITSNSSCTTFHRLHEQSRQDPSNSGSANGMNPCEMLDIGTEFTCTLTTQDLKKEDFISAMKKHYTGSPRYYNMESNLKNFLEKTKETYDFLLPLGKFKGREFNLDDPSYKKLYNNKSLATMRRILQMLDSHNNPINIPIGWVAITVEEI